jgi:hypothetical protein
VCSPTLEAVEQWFRFVRSTSLLRFCCKSRLRGRLPECASWGELERVTASIFALLCWEETRRRSCKPLNHVRSGGIVRSKWHPQYSLSSRWLYSWKAQSQPFERLFKLGVSEW